MSLSPAKREAKARWGPSKSASSREGNRIPFS